MKQLLIITYSFLSVFAYAQNWSETSELDFAVHLIKQGKHADADYVLQHINTNRATKRFIDSLAFYKGWNNYLIKELDSSAYYLKQVNHESTFYEKANFFAAYNLAHLHKLQESANVLHLIHCNDTLQKNLIKYELAGVFLLNRDLPNFKKHISEVNTDLYFLSDSPEEMNQLAFRIANHPDKSPFLAGVMSAIVPGSGKIYAGRFGEGLSTFFAVTALGAVTYENYKKSGLKNIYTIGFGSVFTAFYIGNIWGSTLSVKIVNDEFNEAIDKNILFHMHIPLRNFFE